MSSLDYYDKPSLGTVCQKNDLIGLETAANQHSCAEKCNLDANCVGFTHTNTNNNHKCNLFKDVNECKPFNTLKWFERDKYTHVHWYARNTDFYRKVRPLGPSPLETCENEKLSIQTELKTLSKEKSMIQNQFNNVSGENSDLQIQNDKYTRL